MRNWMLLFVFLLFVIVPFIIWGDWFASFFSESNAIEYIQEFGYWGWLAAIGLLILDLFLPLPASVLIAALGYLYGPLWGGLIAAIGNILSGLVAYYLCRSIGEKGAIKILGIQDYEKGHQLFNRQGSWLIAVSRWMPVLPEVLACMAGLNRMRTDRFLVGLVCGALPFCFLFAYLGSRGHKEPQMALLINLTLPFLLWASAQLFMNYRFRQQKKS